jgi:Methyltransferase domain
MEERLRRLLWPLRPILRPIWYRARPVIDRSRPYSIPVTVERLRHLSVDWVYRAAGRKPRPIRPMRHYELVDLAAREPYYHARVVYMSVAGSAADEMIDRKRLRTALELGPHLRPLIKGADVMDIVHNEALQAEGRRIIANATQTPWPVDDRQYDLFVALQVFEHLGRRQPEAFREVRRVARNAILSLPIDWIMADPSNCHHGLTEQRVLEWFAPVTPTRVIVGNPGHRKRLIYVFEDLPMPGDDGPAEPAPATA